MWANTDCWHQLASAILLEGKKRKKKTPILPIFTLLSRSYSNPQIERAKTFCWFKTFCNLEKNPIFSPSPSNGMMSNPGNFSGVLTETKIAKEMRKMLALIGNANLFSLMWIALPRQQQKRQLECSCDSKNSPFLPTNMTFFQKGKKSKNEKEKGNIRVVLLQLPTQKCQFDTGFILTKIICYCASIVRTKQQ